MHTRSWGSCAIGCAIFLGIQGKVESSSCNRHWQIKNRGSSRQVLPLQHWFFHPRFWMKASVLAHSSIAAAPDNCWTPIAGLACPATASFNRRIDHLFDALNTSMPCTLFFLPNCNAEYGEYTLHMIKSLGGTYHNGQTLASLG